MRLQLLLQVGLAIASHNTYPVCSLPAADQEYCYFDPCPGTECSRFGPQCANGACACGGVIVVGYGGAEGVVNPYGGITSSCFLSKAGCPQSPLPPVAVQAAVATSFARYSDGSSGDRQEVTTCADAVSPSLNPEQCRANGKATKAYLELNTTLNSYQEPYLVPCPRNDNSEFTAAQYEGWYAYQFGPPACSDWCNAYTCDLDACATCRTCAGLSSQNYCAGWCNDWTLGMDHCRGCTPSTESTNKCFSWCNAYVCEIAPDSCSGCAECVAYDALQHCALWCNAYTGGFKHCAGC